MYKYVKYIRLYLIVICWTSLYAAEKELRINVVHYAKKSIYSILKFKGHYSISPRIPHSAFCIVPSYQVKASGGQCALYTGWECVVFWLLKTNLYSFSRVSSHQHPVWPNDNIFLATTWIYLWLKLSLKKGNSKIHIIQAF